VLPRDDKITDGSGWPISSEDEVIASSTAAWTGLTKWPRAQRCSSASRRGKTTTIGKLRRQVGEGKRVVPAAPTRSAPLPLISSVQGGGTGGELVRGRTARPRSVVFMRWSYVEPGADLVPSTPRPATHEVEPDGELKPAIVDRTGARKCCS
jgi:hypothetical protein